nr:cytidine and deoxycytidylate deaminase zinc-binding region [uncultured bacterium]
MAFGSKKPLKELKAIFIAAPREMSAKRFTQLIREYLPQGNIVLGISAEPHVLGFEGQAQFEMLPAASVQPIIDKVAASGATNKVYTLEYSQRDLPYILEKVRFKQVLLVNGSWKYSFHLHPAYYVLAQSGTPFTYVSPFYDEDEARAYEKAKQKHVIRPSVKIGEKYKESELLGVVTDAARSSYDYSSQVGVVLAKKRQGKYRLMAWAHNKVVPYQTYAMHHGASREQNFSPANDLGHYDTVHAETMLVLGSRQLNFDLAGTTLFINVLPCPSCARLLTQTDIHEIVYSEDHSEGYAVKLLEASGKKVRRVVL